MAASDTIPGKPEEQRRYRVPFLLLALLNLAAVGWVIWDETVTRRPWKETQQRFNNLLTARGKAPVPIKIRQVTNPALGVVDRCQTCHLGIDRPGLTGEAVPRHLRTHPRRKVLLGKGHRPGTVGCVVCHHGQGSQTKGVAHAPFDHGRNDPYWERPMLRGTFVESTCVTCHTGHRAIKGAETYNLGRRLFADLRCFGCHDSRRGTPSYPGGPSLEHLKAKTGRAFTELWITDPAALRPHTRMPDFWPDWHKTRRAAEARAMAAYLGSLKPKTPLPRVAYAADASAELGKRLFNEAGCRGCHRLDDEEKGTHEEAGYGPSLARMGDKASPAWLAAWLHDPQKVRPRARMPQMRLKPAERDALVAFLSGHQKKLKGRAWPAASATEIKKGRDLVARYNCAGCHELPGKSAAAGPPPGPTLRDFGDTPADRLEWGQVRDEVQCKHLSPLECWTLVKIRQPRRLSSKQLKLTMPAHRLTASQTRALAVFVLSDRRAQAPAAYRHKLTGGDAVGDEGEHLLAQHNCRSCHEIGRTEEADLDEDGDRVGTKFVSMGGDVRRYYKSKAEAPPALSDAGAKFQYPWLDGFLRQPSALRPWLTVRMPRFTTLGARERGQLIRYLAQRSKAPFPFQNNEVKPLAAADRPDAMWLFRKMQCYKCHQISSMAGLKQADLAPDLALSYKRLQPKWIGRWLLSPQWHIPGTKMPTYFILADEDDPTSHTTPFTDRLGGNVKRQVDALVKLNMRFGLDASLNVLAEVPAEPQKGITP